MNKETMRNNIMKVLDMYDIPWSSYALDKIINIWADNKTTLMELLSHHPNWNDEKCYIAFDQNIKGQVDEFKIAEFINWCDIDNFTFNMLRTYKEQFLTKNMVELIKADYPSLRVAEGQKTSRAVKKICEYEGITEYFGFEKRYAKYSDAINPLDQVRHTIVSVNPVDYLLSSNGNSWSSCHTLDKNNPNGYSGCHCSGTMSYLLDGTTMIYYQVDESYDGTDLEFQPKIVRQMFHYDNGILVQGRLYPQCNDGKNSLYTPIRAQLQKIIADCLVVPNLWKKKGGTAACCNVICSEGTHYRDYSCQEECSVSKVIKMIPKGRVDDRKMTVGHDICCVNCGDYHTMENTLLCRECYETDGKCECNDCGNYYDLEDMHYIDREWYCSDCITHCDCCGQTVPCRDTTYISEGNLDVCGDCLEDHYTLCNLCDEYVPIEDSTYVNSVDDCVCDECLEKHFEYVPKYDDYYYNSEVGYCSVCGETYLLEDCPKGSPELLCPDCVGEFKNE